MNRYVSKSIYLNLTSIPSSDIWNLPANFFLDAHFVILCEKLIETWKDMIVNHKLKQIKDYFLTLERKYMQSADTKQIICVCVCVRTRACVCVCVCLRTKSV